MTLFRRKREDKRCAMCRREMNDVLVAQRYCTGCRKDRDDEGKERIRLRDMDAVAERLESEREIVRKRLSFMPAGCRIAARTCWLVYERWDDLAELDRPGRMEVFVLLVVLRRVEYREIDGLVPVVELARHVEAYQAEKAKGKPAEAAEPVCGQCGHENDREGKRICGDCYNANNAATYRRTLERKARQRAETKQLTEAR